MLFEENGPQRLVARLADRLSCRIWSLSLQVVVERDEEGWIGSS